jgi:hypothetical protein
MFSFILFSNCKLAMTLPHGNNPKGLVHDLVNRVRVIGMHGDRRILCTVHVELYGKARKCRTIIDPSYLF